MTRLVEFCNDTFFDRCVYVMNGVGVVPSAWDSDNGYEYVHVQNANIFNPDNFPTDDWRGTVQTLKCYKLLDEDDDGDEGDVDEDE